MIKNLTLKLFHPGNKKVERQTIHAPAGQRFTEDGVEQILLQTADKIEKAFPTEEYRLVPVGPRAFNFVHAGPKENLQA